jgi:hypothetical protein
MEMQPMGEPEPDKERISLNDAIELIEKLTDELRRMKIIEMDLDYSELEILHKSIDELAKERLNLTLGPSGRQCHICGGTGRI